jgi:hypothetical protein
MPRGTLQYLLLAWCPLLLQTKENFFRLEEKVDAGFRSIKRKDMADLVEMGDIAGQFHELEMRVEKLERKE